MKIILIAFLVIILSSCSLASHSIKDVDRHIAEMTKEGVSTDCIAGFYSGIAINTESEKINRATAALSELSDTSSTDYIRCRAKGLEIGILAISGQKGLDDVIRKAMSLGLF